MQKRVYFDYLDSLRFFAFFVVFIAHAAILFPISSDWFYPFYRNILSHGSYGVNFFFILSGFLISFLLLNEKKETGLVSVRTFYLKRVLRIWPLYYIVFALSIFILPVIVSWVGANYIEGNLKTFPNLSMEIGQSGIWWFFAFLGNFYRAHDWGLTPFALGVLWSVCVEEQFYLFWPWIIKKFNYIGILSIAVLVLGISLIYKAVHINDANIAYYGTLSVAMDLAMGCILGVLYFRYEKSMRNYWAGFIGSFTTLRRFKDYWLYMVKKIFKSFLYFLKLTRDNKRILYFDLILGFALVASLGVFIGMQIIDGGQGLVYDFLRLLKRPVLNVFFVMILIGFLFKRPRELVEIHDTDINTSASAYKPALNKWYNRFTYLGRISYGLYAYHAIFLILILAIFNSFNIGPNDISATVFGAIFVIALVLTITVSHYSYKYIEMPFINLRHKNKGK